MARTPRTIVDHELIGLAATVVGATDPERVGQAGRVVDETRATLVLAGDDATRVVPKAETTLRFAVPDGDRTVPVAVDGRRLVGAIDRRARPDGGESRWH